ncbi:MAG: C_GCAxxG_C_C family protein [Bacteroidales bacterium]|nr:C_GCAxxG_C_C family protein [Candidatus Colimorpha onthohippi]
MEQKAVQLHKEGFNCCQSVVLAFEEQLPVSREVAEGLAAPFGRGLCGYKEVCGCVSAIAMVAGLTGNASKAKEMIEQFKAENGDIVCSRLLQIGGASCRDRVACAAKIIDATLNK